MSADAILELRDVVVPRRRDAETPSLTAVNWSVRPGDFWIVGGMEGGGKGDLAFMLAGLTQPLDGSYTLLGQDKFGAVNWRD